MWSALYNFMKAHYVRTTAVYLGGHLSCKVAVTATAVGRLISCSRPVTPAGPHWPTSALLFVHKSVKTSVTDIRQTNIEVITGFI